MVTDCMESGCKAHPNAPAILTLRRGTTIYHEADPANFWFEVSAGMVRTCRYHANGQRHLTGFYYAEDAFGLDMGVYRETAESVTDVILRRHIKQLNSDTSHPQHNMLEKAFEHARERIFLFGHKTAANRVAAFILEVGERSNALGISLPMSRSDIADYLNLTLHTVSRTISDLARKQLISLNGPQHLRILDLEGLRTVAGEEDLGQEFSSSPVEMTYPWPTL